MQIVKNNLLSSASYEVIDIKTFLNSEHLTQRTFLNKSIQGIKNIKFTWNPGKVKALAISCWILSGVYLTTPASAASVWSEMQPIFRVFQDLAMVLGAIAIIVGLTIMMFKKNTGWQIASTAGLVLLGVFIVPAAVMLLAIIGGMLNDVLAEAFKNSSFGNSVKVGN
jgi:hypothetical protein